MMLHDTKVVTS